MITHFVYTPDIYEVMVTPSINIAPQLPLDWLLLVKIPYEQNRKEQAQEKHECMEKMEKIPRNKNNLEYMAMISKHL